MFSRPARSNGGLLGASSTSQLWKSKNPHSLEYLKYLYGVLCKNQTVTEQNCSLLVEALRSMSEILIWGDQNDDTVFDFFLEKSLLSFFLGYMRQKSSGFICVQLLQTLNILFENISKEASIYYLLSNNHVNSIISHRFDFSDEEVMAYYISFLKTLSLKLNRHTIHFFYNEHAQEFPLYTEAVSFFNHSESMVRIAVRTITLNVYRVDDRAMIRFVREATAVGYFPELVACIGKHTLEMDSCVRNDAEHSSRGRLASLVYEHLDQLHYISDILRLGIDPLSDLLTDQLLGSLFMPIHVKSLMMMMSHSRDAATAIGESPASPPVSVTLATFLLAHVFLTVHHPPLVRQLLSAIMQDAADEELDDPQGDVDYDSEEDRDVGESEPAPGDDDDDSNATDEQKLRRRRLHLRRRLRMRLAVVADSLSAPGRTDYAALFALAFLLAVRRNPSLTPASAAALARAGLAGRLLRLLAAACREPSCVRPVTAELAAQLLTDLTVARPGGSGGRLSDGHWALLEGAREESALSLRGFFRNEELFLDLFEDEWRSLVTPVNVEHLMMDSSLLLAPTGTPLTGIEFGRRLPCGEVERTRRAIRMFLLLRGLCYGLRGEADPDLPLTGGPDVGVRVADSLDLNNSDLIGCRVERVAAGAAAVSATAASAAGFGAGDGAKPKPPAERRFLAIDSRQHQAVLVEPDGKRLGWGVAKFVGSLQHVEVTSDREDSRCLHVAFHDPGGAPRGGTRPPLLAAKFVFDDHIRCMAARQRLMKGRQLVRTEKMACIGRMLELPDSVIDAISPGHSARKKAAAAAAAAASASSAAAPTVSVPGSPSPLSHRHECREPPRQQQLQNSTGGAEAAATSDSAVVLQQPLPSADLIGGAGDGDTEHAGPTD